MWGRVGKGTLCVGGSESHGKTEKVAETVDTQGFGFSVCFSVFILFVFRFPFRFCPLRESLWVVCGQLSGSPVGGHVFLFPSLIPAFAG